MTKKETYEAAKDAYFKAADKRIEAQAQADKHIKPK